MACRKATHTLRQYSSVHILHLSNTGLRLFWVRQKYLGIRIELTAAMFAQGEAPRGPRMAQRAGAHRARAVSDWSGRAGENLALTDRLMKRFIPVV